MTYSFTPIGVIHSCFKDKFGVPRQPGLIAGAHGELELFAPYDREEAFHGLETFSHVWILFVFHQCLGEEVRLTVRPPRLGGNQKQGVFASRSPCRPNPIGMSVVALEEVRRKRGKVCLRLSGLDLIEGTPVLDVKPYLPYADAIRGADGGYAPSAPSQHLDVVFTTRGGRACDQFEQRWPDLRMLIVSVLSLDPRPAYHKGKGGQRAYAVRLYDLDIHWRVTQHEVAEVFDIALLPA